jgi:hypothetical protein
MDPSSTMSAAKGGEVKSYAVGGIASLNQPQIAAAASGMSDQQLQQSQGLPSITQLALDSLQAEEQQRAQRRAAEKGSSPPQSQGTVADAERVRIAAMEQGLGGYPVGGMEFADGGIVGFQEGGKASWEEDLEALQAPPQESSSIGRAITGFFTRSDDVEALRKRAMVKQAQGLPLNAMEAKVLQSQAPATPAAPAAPAAPADAGLGSLIMNDERRKRAPGQMAAAEQVAEQAAKQAAANKGPGPAPAPKPPPSATDGIMALRRAEADRQTTAETEAAKIQQEALAADRAAQQADIEEAGKFGSDRESRLKKREEGQKGAENRNVNTSLIEAGLAIMAGESPNALLNIARGARQGLAGYEARLSKINESKEKLDDDFSRLYELRQEKVNASRKELRALNKQEADLKASGMRNLNNIASGLAGSEVDLMQKDADRAFDMWKAQQESASRERVASIGAGNRGADKQPDRTKQYLDFLGKNPTLALDPTKAMQEFNKMIFMTEGTMPAGPANAPGFRVLGVKQ